MEITSYNHHREGSFLPSVFGPQIKTTGFRIEPSFLSNQHGHWSFPHVREYFSVCYGIRTFLQEWYLKSLGKS